MASPPEFGWTMDGPWIGHRNSHETRGHEGARLQQADMDTGGSTATTQQRRAWWRAKEAAKGAS